MRDHGLSGFDPHVTVKGQVGLDDPDRWLRPVEQRLALLAPVVVRLGQPDWFGEEVLFLTVEGDVQRLHQGVLDALDTAGVEEKWQYDGAGFHPHLTLGAVWAGAARQQLRAMAGAATALRLEPFVTDGVHVYRRMGLGQPHSPWREIQLGTESRR